MAKAENEQNKFATQPTANNNTNNTTLARPFSNSDIKKNICSFNIASSNLNYIRTVSLTGEKTNFLRTFFISTLPRFLKFSEFLNPLYNFGNIRTSIFVKPLTSGESQSDLNDIISSNRKDLMTAEQKKDYDRASNITAKINEADALRDEISSNYNKLFEVSIFSTVQGNDLHNLDVVSESLGITLARSMINIRSCWGTQQSASKSTTPFNTNLLDNRDNVFDIFGAACIFPFVSETINHPKGVIFGYDKVTNQIVYLDGFHNLLPNNNILVLGSKNSRKYQALNLLTLRSCTVSNLKTIAIDTDAHFSKLCDNLLGINVRLSNTTPIVINPFDIEPEIVNDEITGRAKAFINIQEKSRELANLIISMSKATIPNSFPTKTTFDIAYNTILEEYNAIGITSNTESLYTSSKTELVAGEIKRAKKNMPTLGSFFRRLCIKKTQVQDPETLNHYNYLIKYMKDFIKELNGKYPYFDGQTNIALSPNTSFINFDLSRLEKNTLLPITQQVLMNWITEKFVKTSSDDPRAPKKRIILDGSSDMLKYTDSAEIFMNTFNKCSAKRISLAVISDEYSTFAKNQNVVNSLNSCAIKMIMKQDTDDITTLTQQFKLIEGEAEFLEKCEINEGILSAGASSCQLRIDPIGYEQNII